MMDNLRKDLRHSLRALSRQPGFTAVAVITIALGIGATTAIFSVVRNVLLRPLPYDAPDRIVQIWNPWSNEPGVARGRSAMSPPDVADLREGVGSFQAIAAYAPQSGANLTGGEVPERVLVTRANAALFTVLGVRAHTGRTFTATEDAPGRDDVVVLSHALWQRRFGGDPSVIGSAVWLDGAAHQVVGVMPPSFRLPADYLVEEPTEIWRPLALDPENQDRGDNWLHAVARVRPGASIAAANAELQTLTQRWIEQGFKVRDLPPYYAVGIEDELFAGIRPTLLILFGAVAFVLLIACVNVANLLLVRAEGRRGELALRTALGAARRRIVAQLLTESLLLATVGGVLGLLLAELGVSALVALEPANIPRVDEVRIDGPTLAFSAGVTLLTSLIFGMIPAIRASRPDLTTELRASSRSATSGRGGQRTRGALVIAELALSVVLLVGASLMVRSFLELSRVDLGFDPGGVLTFGTTLPTSSYAAPEERARTHAQLAASLEHLPGVSAAGAVRVLPLTSRLGGGSIMVDGAPPPRQGEGLPNVRWQVVTPGYFAAMSYALLAGRVLEPSDRADALPVVVVNQTMAETFWPGGGAVGKRVRTTNTGVPWFTVVGVVGDVRHSGVTDTPSPTMYIPLEQLPLTRTFTPATMSFVLKTTAAPATLVAAARRMVRAVDAGLPVSAVRTMDEIVADATAQTRFTVLLLAIFAATALILAAVGIYGLLSYAVSQRRQEIGIRVALGARRAAVLSLIVWSGMRLALIGLALGILAALFLSRLLLTLLYGVRPADPATYVLVPAVFAAVALAASYIPARRAAGVDPMLALRQD